MASLEDSMIHALGMLFDFRKRKKASARVSNAFQKSGNIQRAWIMLSSAENRLVFL